MKSNPTGWSNLYTAPKRLQFTIDVEWWIKVTCVCVVFNFSCKRGSNSDENLNAFLFIISITYT